MGETARVWAALGRQMRNAVHGCSHRREAGCLFGEPRDLGAMIAKIVLEPKGEGMRVARDAAADIVERQVRDGGDLGGGRAWGGLWPPPPTASRFRLSPTVSRRRLIG